MEPEWLRKARAEGRISEGRSAAENLGLNSPKGELTEKPRKYRNQPVTVDGLRFDSKKEARRWIELKGIADLGGIRNLRRGRDARYVFELNGVRIGVYTPDFVYETLDGETVVEDTKSEATAKDVAYRLRKRLMKAFFNIDVREV